MPHFLLKAGGASDPSNWQFSLETADRTELEVNDFEPFTHGQRLELLAVVRGLEALQQPSRVTLLTSSSYVKRGLAYGIDDWRTSGWRWESHGKMVPVKNADLWRRLDRALQVHQVECRLQSKLEVENRKAGLDQHALAIPAPRHSSSPAKSRRLTAAFRRWSRESGAAIRLRLAQFGTRLLPLPWLE